MSLETTAEKTRRGDGADMTWHVKSRCAYSDTQQTLRVTVIALSDTEGSSCYKLSVLALPNPWL